MGGRWVPSAVSLENRFDDLMQNSMKQHARRWAGRLLGRRDRGVDSARVVPGIPGRVHHGDTMFDPSDPQGVEYYLRAGRSALDVLDRTLNDAGVSRSAVHSVLDYGCGYGRVLRHFGEFFPEASRIACDLDPRAVDFCAREFDAQPVVAPEAPIRLRLPSCDLIWGGSVWTHLPEKESRALFAALAGALSPGGILVFSFHGAFAYDNLHSLFGAAYADEANEIRSELATHGSSYRSYSESYLTLDEGLYGTSWHRHEYFQDLADEVGESLGGLTQVYGEAKGWDQFHDVIAFQRRTPVSSELD